MDLRDMVHNPSHYQLEDGSEVKDHILAVLGREGFIAYAKGNILKYTARAGKKDNADQELDKVQEYAQMIRDVISAGTEPVVWTDRSIAGTNMYAKAMKAAVDRGLEQDHRGPQEVRGFRG